VPDAAPQPYSPRQRTALVLAGTGTAGAYQAGVLRALAEAGVRIDLVAGRGMGAVTALYAAVDAAATLWEPAGLWTGPSRPSLYPWRTIWKVVGALLALAMLALAAPLIVLVALAVAWLPAFALELVAPPLAGRLTSTLAEWAFWVTRGEAATAAVSRASGAAMLVLALTIFGAALIDRRRGARRPHGAPWWQALGSPLDARPVVRWALDGFWNVMKGATRIARPEAVDLGRRYAELLGDNLTQPGYRELLIAAHDLESRRDLIFALLREDARPRFFGGGPEDQRRAEVVDLSGDGGRHVVDAIAGALAVPWLAEPHVVRFDPAGFWRGETHRVCDRPAAIVRLLEEVSAAGAEQVIVVTSDVAIDRPHALRARAVEPRARLAEYIAGAEASAARDALTALFDRFSGVYQIQPTHNAVGLFDADGSYDERSDRRQTLRELVELGAEDAQRQFIDPVLGASGDELERTEAARPPSTPPSSMPPGPTPTRLPLDAPSIAERLASLD
jgi:hypothetical protein